MFVLEGLIDDKKLISFIGSACWKYGKRLKTLSSGKDSRTVSIICTILKSL